jgi:hypothetical protein
MNVAWVTDGVGLLPGISCPKEGDCDEMSCSMFTMSGTLFASDRGFSVLALDGVVGLESFRVPNVNVGKIRRSMGSITTVCSWLVSNIERFILAEESRGRISVTLNSPNQALDIMFLKRIYSLL